MQKSHPKSHLAASERCCVAAAVLGEMQLTKKAAGAVIAEAASLIQVVAAARWGLMGSRC